MILQLIFKNVTLFAFDYESDVLADEYLPFKVSKQAAVIISRLG